MTGRFLSIDPGLGCTGVAAWRGGRLVTVTLIRSEKNAPLNTRIREIQYAISLFENIVPPGHSLPRYCERMQFRYGNNRGDPQHLLDLNLLAGALGTHWITPNEWKGTLPREIEQHRTRALLEPDELALLEAVKPASLAHNAWSAVGIGLHVLRRNEATL